MSFVLCHRPIDVQLNKLQKLIPEIKGQRSDEKGFLIPPWNMISDSYQGAVLKVAEKIKAAHGISFNNFYKDKKGIYLRPSQKSIAHNGGFVRALGVITCNKSAEEVVSQNGEFGLGLFEFMIIVYTHFDVIADKNQLVVCPSDQMTSIGEDEKFDYIPIVKLSAKEITLISHQKTEKLNFGFAIST